VADLLKSRPGIRKVSVEGHTDSSLPALKSIELSEKRAENVKQWLVNNGVEADRLIVRGHGDTRPVASNKTAKGRQANARIELVIVDGAGGSSLSP
jgi:outer membrane protein OmpA-like peptidoglycan-associated protein